MGEIASQFVAPKKTQESATEFDTKVHTYSIGVCRPHVQAELLLNEKQLILGIVLG
jgi:hypothetical protein